jgi:hypothetical protein
MDRTVFDPLHDYAREGALYRDHNPIFLRLSKMKEYHLKKVIEEYSCLSNRAIQFLTTAMIYSYGWDELYKEIEDNIADEKGKRTDGVPHLVIMRNGYRDELGIDTHKAQAYHLVSTRSFLEQMNVIFNTSNKPYLAGAMLAFESVAIEEFYIVDHIIIEYLARQGKEISGLTKQYIDGHLKFEVDHSSNLEKAILAHLTEEHLSELERGYKDVCDTMDEWWIKLDRDIR